MEEEEFETFFRSYQNMVFSVSARIVGNLADAEEITQEVFINAYARFSQLRNSKTVGGWLKTVATNLSINHLNRYRARWRFFSEQSEPVEIATEVERGATEKRPWSWPSENFLTHMYLGHAMIPVWVALSVRDVGLEKFNLGADRFESPGEKTGGFILGCDYSAALTRALSSLLSLIPFGLGFIWILFNRDLQAWHDRISETCVVRIDPSTIRSTTPPSSSGPTATPPQTM